MKYADNSILSLKRPRLSDEVGIKLENYLLKNKLSPNDKLPSERELCQMFDVGSRTIREALKLLEAKGLIRIVQGKGAFVNELGFDEFMKGLANSLRFATSNQKGKLLELMDVRRIIETSVVQQVAQMSTISEDIQKQMETNLKAQRRSFRSRDVDKYTELDTEYHELLIAFSGNSILMTIYSNLDYLLRSGMSKTGYIPGSFKRGLDEHTALLKAILDHDAAQATEIIEKHIASSTHILSELISSEEN